MVYAIFTRKGSPRRMHAVEVGAHKTVCGLSIGIGTGLVRDGNYANNTPCAACWKR
jgi:hypothetical protein